MKKVIDIIDFVNLLYLNGYLEEKRGNKNEHTIWNEYTKDNI